MHTTSRPLSQTTVLLVASALTVLLAASSCGSSDQITDPPSNDPAGSSVEATAPTTVETRSDVKGEVRLLLDRFWPIWLAANNPPDPKDPHLTEVLSGDALAVSISKIQERAAAGQALSLPASANFEHQLFTSTMSPDPNRFTGVECVVDDIQVIDRTSGAVVDGSTATYEILRDFVRDDLGRWTISRSRQQSRLEGVGGCALQLQH